MALVLLMALALLSARAENAVPSALYRIVERTEAGERTLGTGVLFGSPRMLLTAAGCWSEGELVAIGADGEHAIAYKGEIAGTQLLILGLATDSTLTPLTATVADSLMSNALYGAAADGGFVSHEVTLSRTTAIDDRAEVLLSAGEGLLPGAIMLGADGGVACITLWQQGEGAGVYAAVANVTLSRLMTGTGESAQETEGLVHGFTATVEDGQILLDWTDAQYGVITENTVFTAYVTATCNPYLSYDEITGGETTAAFPAIPGTEMLVWIAVSEGPLAEHVFPETAADSVLLTVPAGEAFTGYGFQNLRCGVTAGEPGLDGVITEFLPQQPLTRELLSDRTQAIYFQTEDVYTVEKEDSDHVLLLALNTPEGYVFTYYSGYIFMPEMNASDMWLTDISAVFEDYELFVPEAERWPAGEYALAYYIDGSEAARIPFTLD